MELTDRQIDRPTLNFIYVDNNIDIINISYGDKPKSEGREMARQGPEAPIYTPSAGAWILAL